MFSHGQVHPGPLTDLLTYFVIGVGTMGAMRAAAPIKFALWRHSIWLHDAFALGRFCPAPIRRNIFLHPCLCPAKELMEAPPLAYINVRNQPMVLGVEYTVMHYRAYAITARLLTIAYDYIVKIYFKGRTVT